MLMALPPLAQKHILLTSTIHLQHRMNIMLHDWNQDDIRLNIWDRIEFENESIPNTDALYNHWKRTCWVADMWHQSTNNYMELMPLSEFGWLIDGDSLTIHWDSAENVTAVQQRVASLLKGCKCKTGCATSHCGCKKKKRYCSAGCECISCVNTATPEPATDNSLHQLILEEEIATTTQCNDSLTEEVDKIMDWVFGEQCT